VKSERGGVTVELALALPAVVALAALLLSLGAAALSQMRCADAARAGAREAALGSDNAGISATVRLLAGQDTRVTIDRQDSWVTVRVERQVPLPGRVLTASAAATAACEPDRGCR